MPVQPLFWPTALARIYAALSRSRREPLTLDQLRSDLSHEASAKLARLQALIEDWRQGRDAAADADDARALLRDLERIQLRHARLACARPGTSARLVHLLAALTAARVALRDLGTPPRPAVVTRFERIAGDIRVKSREQVEALSAAYGARVTTLASGAVETIRAESGHGSPEGIGVELHAPAEAVAHWVPRRDAERWADLLRNLVRNAVQATEDRRLAGGAELSPPGPVRVRVESSRGRPGVVVEIADEGVGMDAAAAASMWNVGRSSHGAHRGEGLTEGKRAFLCERAELEVRSVVGRGTCVRLELPHGEVPVRVPPLLALPVVAVPLLAIGAAVALAFTPLAAPQVVRVDVVGQRWLRAFDGRERVVWKRQLEEDVLDNWLSSDATPRALWPGRNQHVVLAGRQNWQTVIVVATQPPSGPGHLVRLDAWGHVVWRHTLSWRSPWRSDAPAAENLTCIFETPVRWPGRREEVLALNVRRGDHSATEIQFVTLGGRLLGAYDHPGQLEYVAELDVDADGNREVVLSGINNRARFAGDTLDANGDGSLFVDCLVALRPPKVSGQAWPGATWRDVPRAAEAAYLLVPPLRDSLRPRIGRVYFGRSDRGTPQTELLIEDGRRLVLDANLHPLQCIAGDNTTAARLAPTWPIGPIVYFHDGRREDIRLPVGGTSPGTRP